MAKIAKRKLSRTQELYQKWVSLDRAYDNDKTRRAICAEIKAVVAGNRPWVSIYLLHEMRSEQQFMGRQP